MPVDWLIAGLEKSQRECWKAPHVYSLFFIFSLCSGAFGLSSFGSCLLNYLFNFKWSFVANKTKIF